MRDLYPSTSKFARRGEGNASGPAPLADAPTLAAPGSEEKIAAMMARVRAGKAIHHPEDGIGEGNPQRRRPAGIHVKKVRLPVVRELLGAQVAKEVLKADPPKQKPKPPRPVPKLKAHKRGARVLFKVRGRRVAVYFGKPGTEAAERKYRAWARRWPAQLNEPLPSGKWPKLRLVTFRGKTQSIAKWAAEVGLKSTTVRNRLDVQKWTVEKALTTPKGPPRFSRATT